MAWWEVLLLVIFVLAVATIGLQAWHQFRCSACRTAMKAIRERHPNWRVVEASHRASEPHRDVVAVFYTRPHVVTFPTQYLLVAVYRDGTIEDLPDDIESPYAIRGYK